MKEKKTFYNKKIIAFFLAIIIVSILFFNGTIEKIKVLIDENINSMTIIPILLTIIFPITIIILLIGIFHRLKQKNKTD